ncbi:MAG: hypothetical protein JSR54_07510 [Proteobacteria bacterium]|nr:hypothetical protein [Pseudomonadota bacterium]
MQRVVNLVASLSSACHQRVSFRAMTEAASATLVELYPDASVVIFERDAVAGNVRAVAGARIPRAWSMRAVSLADVPLVASAFAQPDTVLQGGALHREAVAKDDPVPVGALRVICGAIPDPVRPAYAILFFAPPNADQAKERLAAVDIARRMLAGSAMSAGGSAQRLKTLASIHAAKREWELTADALPEVVGLVDARHRVVRINRALERWSLGTVKDALRRDLHDVLHARCEDPGCALAGALGGALAMLATEEAAAFELADERSGRDLVVLLRRAAEDPRDAPDARAHAAFVVQDVTSLRSIERELKTLNHALEQRVEERTEELTATNRLLREEVTRRSEIERDLLDSQRELEGLSDRLMSTQEEERQRIAQDLHDSIGQSLGALKYSLERAQVLLRRFDNAAAASLLESTVLRIQRLMTEVRSISMNLRPAVLDDLGAASAVRFLCREWHDVYQDIAIDTDIAVDDADIPQALGTNVFRAVQESLNNVARHANAQRVEVSMRVVEGHLKVAIRDDGAGFALSGDVRRLVDRPELRGLRGLRERAARAGGRCDVSSAPGRGTTVLLEWPITGIAAARDANAQLN